MISLRLPAEVEASEPFVLQIGDNCVRRIGARGDFVGLIVEEDETGITIAGRHGLVSIDGIRGGDIQGDVLLIDPASKVAERVIRANSSHNTLLVTERCDQLCQMCSQPPKKTHRDRFALLQEACLLAPEGMVIGITGGEPTLYKTELLALIENVLGERPDLAFHVLSNAQHFEAVDSERLRNPLFERVLWGIPLYSASPAAHDQIVGKQGAFARLEESFAHLAKGGARVELRTVLLTTNAPHLMDLARHVTLRLPFVERWAIMQLENIGFARNRWTGLLYDHSKDFAPIAGALNRAVQFDQAVQLFNFPLCTVPEDYRCFAVRSISDWKQKYADACTTCSAKESCSGFFEWHPDNDADRWARPI